MIKDGTAIGQHAFAAAGSVVVYGRTNLDALMITICTQETILAEDADVIGMRRLFILYTQLAHTSHP